MKKEEKDNLENMENWAEKSNNSSTIIIYLLLSQS